MSEKVKDNITVFHDYGIYIPTRTLEITGEIDEDQYSQAVKNIHMLDSTRGTINIKLNSEGGDVYEGRAIYDTIRNCKEHVRIIVYGQASSAASFILQAADERVMAENSFLMMHIGEEGYPNNHPRNIDAWREYNKKLEVWMENVYLQKIKQVRKRYTRNQLKSLLQFDKILTPKEALDLGLIDVIGDPQ